MTNRVEKYEDMIKSGILDPTKVVRIALQNASSIAGLLLTTEGLVAELPEEEKTPSNPLLPAETCTERRLNARVEFVKGAAESRSLLFTLAFVLYSLTGLWTTGSSATSSSSSLRRGPRLLISLIRRS